MSIKLYDLPRGALIKEATFNDKGEQVGDFIRFDHIDGMYSYCTILNDGKDKGVIHLSASTPIKPTRKGYFVIDI